MQEALVQAGLLRHVQRQPGEQSADEGNVGMREIKFRAWDKQNSNMIDGNNYQGSAWIADALEVLMHGGCDEWTEQLVLMQYTGLHDKNGKEIYEGDIIRECYTIFPDDMEVFISEVLFQNGSFQLSGEDYEPFSGESSMCSIKSTDLEVIGNVWENPELLGGAA